MLLSSPAQRARRDLEDGYAIVVGTILVVLGLLLLKTAGLVTGGVAGIALILAHFVPVPEGVLFTAINLPFFLLAHRLMGLRFTAKTIFASCLIAGLSIITRLSVTIGPVNPLFAAVVGGTVIGMGSLALLRHRTGVGGIGVVALWLERRRGWKVGVTTLAFDIIVLALAIPLLGPTSLLCSALSAAAISGVLLTWHRVESMA